MPIAISRSEITGALACRNYIEISDNRPRHTPRHACVGATQVRPPAHSCDLRIGTDSRRPVFGDDICTDKSGFSLHAAVRCAAENLEQLCPCIIERW
jgi:hypothetical protein